LLTSYHFLSLSITSHHFRSLHITLLCITSPPAVRPRPPRPPVLQCFQPSSRRPQSALARSRGAQGWPARREEHQHAADVDGGGPGDGSPGAGDTKSDAPAARGTHLLSNRAAASPCSPRSTTDCRAAGPTRSAAGGVGAGHGKRAAQRGRTAPRSQRAPLRVPFGHPSATARPWRLRARAAPPRRNVPVKRRLGPAWRTRHALLCTQRPAALLTLLQTDSAAADLPPPGRSPLPRPSAPRSRGLRGARGVVYRVYPRRALVDGLRLALVAGQPTTTAGRLLRASNALPAPKQSYPRFQSVFASGGARQRGAGLCIATRPRDTTARCNVK